MDSAKIRGGQSSLEFLVAFGLLILVIAIAVVVVWQTGVLRPASCEKYKTGFSQVVPVDWAAYRDSNTLVLSVENQAGYDVNVTDASANVGDVMCSSTLGMVMRLGDRIPITLSCSGASTLSNKYVAGDCYSADVRISYVNTGTGNSHESRGKIRGAIEGGATTTTPLFVFLSRLYGGSSFDSFHSVHGDSNYIYAVGCTRSEGRGGNDALIVKYHKSNLSLASRKIYGGGNNDSFHSVHGDSDYIYAVGHTSSEGQGRSDILIVKFNKSDLSIASRKVYGGNSDEYSHSVHGDSNYIYVVGETSSEGQGNTEALIVKYNKSDLSITSRKIYGGGNSDVFHSVHADSNHIYAVGHTNSEGQGNTDALIVKYHKSDLSLASGRIYGGGNGEVVYSVYTDSNYIYVVGETRSEGGGGNDALIVKYHKSNLSLASGRIYGGGNNDDLHSVYGDSKYIYAVGCTRSEGGGGNDALIVKYHKSNLSLASRKIYGGGNNDALHSVHGDSDYIYAVGHTNSEGQGSYDSLVVKFNLDIPSGTYASNPAGFTFQDSALTLADSALTSADSGLTPEDSALTSADSALTPEDSDLILSLIYTYP